MGPARFLHWQMTCSYTEHQGTPSRQPPEAMQQQLDSISQWCYNTRSLISPDKARTLWCTLDKRAACKPKPAVIFHGAVVEQTSHLRYLGIHFGRMLTYRQHVEITALKCKKGLSVLKATAAKGTEQRHIFQRACARVCVCVYIVIVEYSLYLSGF